MILERAIFKVKLGEEQQFQDAVAQAREFPAASRGLREMARTDRPALPVSA